MTTLITVTNNYFQDLASYIEAMGLPKNTKLKKDRLYVEIESYNRLASAEIERLRIIELTELLAVEKALNEAMSLPVNVVEVTEENSFDDLFANWQQAKEEKKAGKAKAKAEKTVSIVAEWTLGDEENCKIFPELKGIGKAQFVYALRQRHSTAVLAEKLGISPRDVARKYNACCIYNEIESVRNALTASWGKFEGKIGILSIARNSEAYLTQLTAQL